MNFKNSINLLFPTFGSTFKIALYRLIALIVALSLAAALVLPNVMYILRSLELSEFFGAVNSFFKRLTAAGDLTDYGSLIDEKLQALIDLIFSKPVSLTMAIIWFFVVLIVHSFLKGFSDFAFGGVINDHMSTLSNIGFTRCLIRNLRKACFYQLVCVSLKMIYYVVMIPLLYLLLILLLPVFGIFAVTLILALLFVMLALKFTFLSSFMPAMIADDKGIKKSIRKSVENALDNKKFLKMFAAYIVAEILIVAVNLAFGLFTIGVALVITIPLSSMLLVSMSFVFYYHFENKKYYVNYDNIVVPKQLREDEKYLNEMDI